MSDTVKLIIEIPKHLYDVIKNKECTNRNVITTAVENGIPLDDVRAKIKSWYWQADKQALAKDPCVVDAMVDLFIRTIDSIGRK